MGRCVEMIVHEACGSGRLQVFQQEDGSFDAYCYACGSVVKDPYNGKQPPADKGTHNKKTEKEIQEEIEEISTYQCIELPKRSLKKQALERFGVKIGLSRVDGSTPETYHFPYTIDGALQGYKCGMFQLMENGKKRVWSVGNVKKVDLFGWDQAIATGEKRLYITEGEFDAVALFAIIMKEQFGTQYQNNLPAVVSLPHGASAACADINHVIDKIKRHFKEVVLVFDMDEAGKDATDKVLKEHPTFLSAVLPKKDANECLIEGNSKAAFSAVKFKAERPKNTRLVWGSSLHEAARKEPAWGLSWPWEGMTQLTRGIRFGEVIYIGAGVKMGKSEVVNALGAHMIMKHGLKVLMAKPEEANVKTYQLMVGKAAGRIFHDPKVPFDHAAYDKASPLIWDNLCMVNLYQHMGWKTLEADIRMAAAMGCKAIFIDPITNLTANMDSAQANTALQEIATTLSSMALDLDVVIFVFCHLKAPENGLPHELGGKVFSNQFAGSRAMMRSCNYMIALEGNKSEDLPEEQRNVRTLKVLEDREFGQVGHITLFWDKDTGLFSEVR